MIYTFLKESFWGNMEGIATKLGLPLSFSYHGNKKQRMSSHYSFRVSIIRGLLDLIVDLGITWTHWLLTFLASLSP